jgi:hypothetical protein
MMAGPPATVFVGTSLTFSRLTVYSDFGDSRRGAIVMAPGEATTIGRIIILVRPRNAFLAAVTRVSFAVRSPKTSLIRSRPAHARQ